MSKISKFFPFGSAAELKKYTAKAKELNLPIYSPSDVELAKDESVSRHLIDEDMKLLVSETQLFDDFVQRVAKDLDMKGNSI